MLSHTMRLLIPRADIGDEPIVVACGDTPELGDWKWKNAPRLKPPRLGIGSTQENQMFEARVCAKPGSSFKFAVIWIDQHGHASDQNFEDRPHRKFPGRDHEESYHFNHIDSFEGPEVRTFTPYPNAVTEIGKSADTWIQWQASSCAKRAGPRTIFHAFNWQFSDAEKRLREFRDMGFDAVQISPAQKSKDYKREWWSRYQPQDYSKIEGLGSLADLKKLCEHAEKLGVMIIADVVFNHMLVAASSNEWERAQHDPKFLKALQQRLIEQVQPGMEVDDFQWPWFKLEGEHWDNENRFEGWGNGEWSELRHCPNVVKLHQDHLQLLLDAGVRGVRFDAVKHMRPAHLAEYTRFLQEYSDDVYFYGEVLSNEQDMHKEYMAQLRMPTTDFAVLNHINKILVSEKQMVIPKGASKGAGVKGSGGYGKGAAGKGKVSFSPAVVPAAGNGFASPPAVSAAGKGGGAVVAPESGEYVACSADPTCPILANDSIRFARNHDTVCNESLSGLECIGARVVWTWLLAVHDGTVLVFPEDLFHKDSADILKRALDFRKRMAGRAVRTEVCLRYKERGGYPMLLMIALLSSKDTLVGVCLVNLLKDSDLRLNSVPAGRGIQGGFRFEHAGEILDLYPDGMVRNLNKQVVELDIRPLNSVFLMEATQTLTQSSKSLILLKP